MDPFYPEQPDYIAKLNTLNSRIAGTGVITYAATINFDITQSQRTWDLLLTGPCTINFLGAGAVALGDASLAAYDGFIYAFRPKQDGIGSRILTFGTGARFGTDFTSLALSTTPGKGDRITTQYCHADGKMDILGYSRGF